MRHRGGLFAGVCSLSVVAAGAALAADGDAAPAKADGRTVSELVVTAAPYAVSVDSLTSSVNVISREQLSTSPPVGLGDLLNGLPGLRSTFFGPGASRPVIRGLSGPRVLVLQNGVGQIDVSDVSPDHAVPSDTEEAARIEVLRGPSTLAYGGSGIGGVVNVIDDRIPSRRVDKGVDGSVTASGSSVDDGWNLAGHLHAGKGPWVLALEGIRRRTQDYSVPTSPLSERQAVLDQVTPEQTRTVKNTSTDVKEVGAGLSYVGDRGYLGASIRRTLNDYGVPYAQVEGVAPNGKVGINLRQTRVDLRGEQQVDLGPFDKVKFSGGWAQYRHAEVDAATGEVGTQFSSKGEEARLELVQKESGGRQGAFGLQALRRNRTAAGDEVLVPSTDIDEFGVFTLQRLDKGGWGLEGGLRADLRRLDTDLAGRAASASATSLGIDWETAEARRSFTGYSGSAAVFVRPMQDVFASVSVSHNERAPTEYELWADGPHDGTHAFEIGDPALHSEKVDSVEGTLRYTAARATLEGHLYWARYSGFIQETATGQAEDGLPVQQFQATNARFVGVEGSGSYELWRGGDRSIRAEATYDWVRGTSDQGPIARIPPWSVTGRLLYRGPVLNGRIEVRHIAAQDRLGPFESPTDAYTMLNGFLSVKPIPGKDVRLFVEGRNLTNQAAREHTSFLKEIAPLPGRNIRVGISCDF